MATHDHRGIHRSPRKTRSGPLVVLCDRIVGCKSFVQRILEKDCRQSVDTHLGRLGVLDHRSDRLSDKMPAVQTKPRVAGQPGFYWAGNQNA